MVTRSLFTGVSGLQTHRSKMDTLSNNISNINTPGFKKSNAVFKSFLSQKLSAAQAPTDSRGGVNPTEIGLGSQVGSVSLDMSQGQLQRTGVDTDLAVQGEGFFQVRESGSTRDLFTRAGSFQLDAEGRMVDPSTGNIVQGFNSQVQDGEIQFNPDTATLEDVQITPEMEVIPGEATTQQEFIGNLDANSKKGIDPMTVSFQGRNETGQSEMRFEFERYHPQKKLYRFTAEWTKNPPSGKQIGDKVVDRITNRPLQGIMKLNQDGNVTQVYANSDRADNETAVGISQIEVDRDNSGEYTIDEDAVRARDQKNIFEDLQPDVTDKLRMTMLGDVNNDGNENFTVEWQDVDGNWNYFQQDGTQSADGTDNTGAATGPTSITGDNPWPTELRQPDSDGNGTNDFTPVVGTLGQHFSMKRDVDGDGGVEREGEIRIDSDFVDLANSQNISVGDQIFFNAQSAEGNRILNQRGEESKDEFRWGGPGAGSFRVSDPESFATNASEAELDQVFNYSKSSEDLETNLNGSIENSQAINNIPNKEFSVMFSGDTTYHVAAQTSNSGVKGTTQDMASAATSGGGRQTIDVSDARNFEVGDLVRLEDTTDSEKEAAIVTGIPEDSGPGAPQDQIEVAGFAGGDDLSNDYQAGNNTQITTLGQALTNQNGSLTFSQNRDERLFVDDDPTTDSAAVNDGSGIIGDPPFDALNDPDTEIGIDIAAENWSAQANASDEFRFTASQARSVDSGRAFSVVRDGDGALSSVFMPEGEPDSPSSINFTPNLTDSSGILGSTIDTATSDSLVTVSGSGNTVQAKTDEEVQVAASSDAFDSQGDQHTVSYRFERKGTDPSTGNDLWMFHVKDPTPVNPEDPEMAGFGLLEFDSEGGLVQQTLFNSRVANELPPTGPQGDLDRRNVYFNPPSEELQSDPEEPDSLNPDNGSKPVSILPDFGNITQFAGNSDAEISDQDGTNRGRLQSFNFDTSGILNGSYDNGETRRLAQVALATFQNPAGLSKQGSTYFAKSANSGIPQTGKPNEGGRGSITPGALERSNVDLSSQFTEMISTQRGFQANTRAIQTSDQLIQSVLQLI